MGRFFLFTAIFAVTLIVLFFPIFINGSVYFDIKEKKFAFSFNLYKKLKIKGGYITSYPKGLALHVNKNKVILFPYKKLNTQKQTFSITKSFELLSLKGIFEGNIELISFVLFLDKIFEQCKKIEPKLRVFDFSFWITEKTSLTFSVKTVFFFTNFMLLLDLFKFIGRKLNGYKK